MADDPYAELTDDEVFQRCIKSLGEMAQYPPGDVRHELQWDLYQSAKAELDRRLYVHARLEIGI